MLLNNHFQYKRINNELKRYNTSFSISSIVYTSDDIQLGGYGFKYGKELYYIVRNLYGKYTICKLKNHKIYGVYAEDMSYKELLIALKNILN